MKMKTIYIVSGDKSVIDGVAQAASGLQEAVQIAGAGPQSNDTLRGISLVKPDYVLVGQMSTADCETLLKLSPETKIAMLADDENRAAATINELEADGFKGCTFFTQPRFKLSDVVAAIAAEAASEKAPSPADGLSSFLDGNAPKAGDGEAPGLAKVAEIEDGSRRAADASEAATNAMPALEDAAAKHADDEKKRIDLLNLKSKFITVWSLKGGTGKTTLAKEMGYIFGSIMLPPKLGYASKYLRVCVVDLDFDQGNLRTQLGLDNPNPNIYLWIDDILAKVEKGIPLERISYDSVQIMTRFVREIGHGLYAMTTAQGGLPQRMLAKAIKLDVTPDHSFFQQVIGLILKSLRSVFDIVICDAAAPLDEAGLRALTESDVIIYPLEPTVADIENMKVACDELKRYKGVSLSKVMPILNKTFGNTGIGDSIDDMVGTIGFDDYSYEQNKQVKKSMRIAMAVPFDFGVPRAANSFGFACEKNGPFKNAIIKLDEAVLPIFRSKKISEERILTEKKKLEALEAQNRENEEKRKMEKRIAKAKAAGAKVPMKVTSLGPSFSRTALKECRDVASLKKYLASVEGVVTTQSGFPLLKRRPAGARLLVWHRYVNERSREIESIRKARTEAKKAVPGRGDEPRGQTAGAEGGETPAKPN
jgi:cellulose biosynthesis protein BcsQ